MSDVNDEFTATQKQIEDSQDAISDLIEECNEMVTNIKIANDLREINRRKEEKSKEERRTTYLEEEAAKSQQKFDEINAKWDPISKYNDSIDIYNACEEQKKKCEELLNCRNEVIETLKKDLSITDERFVNDQVIQRNDINLMSHRIDKQIEILRNAYRKHLRLIEETVVQERATILEKYQSELLQLNEKYEREEVQDIDARNKMVEEFEKDVDNMYSEHFEKHSAAKENLEDELQKLQLDFEELKASCSLDEKKLEYNYLVLTKRQKELVQVKSEQKQKINRLRDTVTKIRQQIDESEKKFKIESKKLKHELAEFDKDFQRNSEKMLRLAEINENTFKKLWQLNEQRAMKLLKKIFQVDKQLHEEVLHIEWKPLEFKLMVMNDLPSIKLALQHKADAKLSDEDANDDQINEEKSILPKLSSDIHLTKFILREIAKNVDILNYQIGELTKTLPEKEQNLVYYDYILKALKIERKSQLELLKKYVTPHIECLTCKENNPKQNILSKYQKTLRDKKRTGSGYKREKPIQERPSSAPQSLRTDEENFEISLPKIHCLNPQHSWCIDSFSLINAISNFILAIKQQKCEKKSAPLEKLFVSRTLSEKDMEMFWVKFIENFPKEKEHLWNVTQKCLDEFLSVAQEESVLQEELKNLEKCNSEMKQLLNQFSHKMSSDCKSNI